MKSKFYLLIQLLILFYANSIVAQTPAAGNALAFNGSNHVRIPTVSALKITGDVAVEAYVNIPAIQSGEREIFINSITDTMHGYVLGLFDGKPFFSVVSSAGTFYANTALSAISTNQWHHIAGVRSAGNTYLYVDGVLINTLAVPTGSLRTGDGENQIGGANGINMFSGSIDELRIWNVARMSAQIKQNSSFVSQTSPGLVAYYKMNEGSGQMVTNATAISANGTLGANNSVAPDDPTWASSPIQTAPNGLNFDGTDDVVFTVNPPENIPSGASPFTTEVWIKPTTQIDTRGIVAWGSASYNSYNGIELVSDGIIAFFYNNDLRVATPDLADNKWHHIAVTYDGTSRKIYLDGILVGTDNPPAPNVASTNLTIGNAPCCAAPFKGDLDEVRIWNVARSHAQIMASMETELTGNENNLVAYYNFNQGQAAGNNTGLTVLPDLSGSNTGTLSNFTITNKTSNYTTGFTTSTTQSSPYGRGVKLNGSTDYINVGNLGAMPVQGSVSFWMKAEDFSTHRNVLTTGNINGCSGGNDVIRFEAFQGNFGASIGESGGCSSSGGAYFPNAGMVLNTQYHIVLSWDRTANNIKGYLNGNLVFNQAHTNWPSTLTFPEVKIGVGWDINRKWIGSIDEVTFWNKALSGAEVLNVRNDLFSASDPNLYAYYSFDRNNINGDGQTVPDEAPVTPTIAGTTVGTPTTPAFVNSIASTTCAVGDTSIVPINLWNQYGYTGHNIDLTNITYNGLDTFLTVDFDTRTHWASGAAPSNSDTWNGCSLPSTNWTLVFKRKGFPAGSNTLNFPLHDDEVRVYKNGRQVFERGCCSGNEPVYLGKLGADTTIEIRLGQVSGEAGMIAKFSTTALDGGSISGTQFVCGSNTPSQLNNDKSAYAGDAPMSISYQWQDSVGAGKWRDIPGANGINYQPASAPAQITSYRRKATDNAGGTAFSNKVVITPQASVGNPSIFPVNVWNQYGYNGRNIDSTGISYFGSDTFQTTGFNTRTHWDPNESPSVSSTWKGCTLPADQFTVFFKRKGFPKGPYSIEVTEHDDEISIYKNGRMVFEAGCCNIAVPRLISVGYLDIDSTIEIRLGENNLGAFLGINMLRTPLNGGTISGSQRIHVPYSASTLTNTNSAYGGNSLYGVEYQWQDSTKGHTWKNIEGANALTFEPGALSDTTAYRRFAKDNVRDSAFSNTVIVYVRNGTQGITETETNNDFTSANSLAVDKEITGMVCSDDGPDFIKTVLPSDGKYRIYIEAVNVGNGSGLFEVHGYDQRKSSGLLFNNTIAYYTGPGHYSTDSVDLFCRAAGDTIYLRLTQSSQCYRYYIRYKLVGAPGDNDIEPNNTFREATTFNIGDTAKGHIGYVAGGDVVDLSDYYKTVLPADGKYRIYMEATNTGNASGLLYVNGYDQRQGSGILFNSTVAYYSGPGSTTVDSTDLFCRAAGDTLYFRITQSSQCFSYKITYKLIGSASDNDAESNNTFEEAISFNPGDTVKGHIGYEKAGIVSDAFDYYKTIIPANGRVRVYMEATNTGNSSGLLYVSGYDQRKASGNLFNSTVAYYSAPGVVSIDSVDLYGRSANDTFYFRVSQSSQCFNYKLTYTVITPAVQNDIEPNNSIVEATGFKAGNTITGHIGYVSGSTIDSYDNYKSLLPSEGTIKVYVEATNTGNGSGLLYLNMYDSKQSVIDNRTIVYYGGAGTTTYDSFTVSCRGVDTTYFRLNAAISSFTYKLKYEMIAANNYNETETNNSFSEAKLINAGDTLAGRIGYLAGIGNDEDDYYKTKIPYKGTVRVFLEATNTGSGSAGNFYITGYDKNLNQVFNRNPAYYTNAGVVSVDSFNIFCQNADTLYFRITRSNQCYSYKLRYQVTLGADTTVFTCAGCNTDISKLYDIAPFTAIKYEDLGTPGSPVNPRSVKRGTYILSVYNGADECSRDTAIITVSTGQSITFDSIPDKVIRDAPFVVKATSSVGLPVTYKILNGPATIKADTVTVTGVGSVTIRAEQSGNNTYNYAMAERTFNVKKGTATITLGGLRRTYDGQSVTPTVVTNPPSLPVNFTFNGNQTVPVNAGSYFVVATVNSPEYSGSASDTFVIQKANQSISITPVPDKEYGNSPFNVIAAASSGLPITYTLATSPANIASISGNTITINDLGTVIVRLVQNGNVNYYSSASVADTFVINKGNQVITFTAIPDKVIGDTVLLKATASSSLPVTYTFASTPASGVATLKKDTLVLNGTTGNVIVTATQTGNQYYNSETMQQSFKVEGRGQTITFETIGTKIYGETPPFGVKATSTSGLPVAVRIVSGPAVINNNIITLTGNGTVVLEATQQGSSTYAAAPVVQQSFIVTRRYPDLTIQNVTSGNANAGPNDSVTISWRVANVGDLSAINNWTERIFMQSASGENRTFITQVTFANNDSLRINQSISRSAKISIPTRLNIGNEGVFVVEVVPGSAISEASGANANNTGIQQAAWIVKKILTLELSGAEITEGSAGIMATVSRTASITIPLTVNLALSNPARFTMPSSVTIPAGQSAYSFPLEAVNNNVIETTLTDSLRVSATNFSGAKSVISLLNDDKPTLTITQLPVTVMEGQSITFKVNTDLTPNQPLVVYLTSNNQSRFPVPATVTIPAGVKSANVVVVLEQELIPEIDVPVNIIAGAAGHISASATTEVRDDDIPGLEMIVETNMISENAGYYATKATLRRTANSNPIAFTANLSANRANTLILPPGISLAAGENEKSFNIGVIDNSVNDGVRNVSITASTFVNSCGCNASSSSGSVSASIVVNDNDGPALRVTASPLTLPEGLPNAGSLRIERNTDTKDALSVSLVSLNRSEATIPATAIIPAGQSFVDVNVTTINDGITDGNQQAHFQASSNGFSTGSVWLLVSDQNKPDFVIPEVKIPGNSVQAMTLLNYQVSIKNSGFSSAPSGALVRGYLSLDNVVDPSDTLISEDIISDPIPAGQSKQILNAVNIPNLPGSYKLLYIVNPELTLTELLTTNNTSTSADITIKPDYTATAAVDKTYFLQGTPVPVTGSAARSNGSAAANVKVEVYVIVNGLRRTVSATTDATGKYVAQFIPLSNEAGHYLVGASYPGTGATSEQDNFDILGVRVNGGETPQFKVLLQEKLTGTMPVLNMSNTSLINFSLLPVNVPGGAVIRFDTVPVFAGNATINLGYTIIGSSVSPGTRFEIAGLKALAKEGTIQAINVYYFCQAPNAYIEADIANINVTASQSAGERIVEFKLVNKGKGLTGDVTIDLPQANWLSHVTPKIMPSMAPGDTSVVVLKFSALPEVPFNYPIKGNIAVTAQNGNSFSLPFSFEKSSESKGTVKITATNQFTYYSNLAPKVKGAHVVIKNYYSGEVYLDAFTDSSGVLLASAIPEGTHRILVTKEQHQPYSSNITINPGQTVESTVFLNYQAITFNWSVVPTAIDDQYEITLESKFETNVPLPVVTIDMPKNMPQLSGSETYAFNVIMTNHGLITANEVKLGLPQDDNEYEFVTNYIPANLLAQQSISVPVIMRRRTTSAGRGSRVSIESVSNFLGIESAQFRSAAKEGSNCQGFTSVSYWYTCNFSTGLWEKGGKLFSYSGRECTGGPTSGYIGIPIDVGGIPTGDGGGYNDVPCATCGPNSFTGKATKPTEPVKDEKKSCIQCINDIAGVIQGCGGPGGAAVGAGTCILGNWLDNKGAADYLTCIPGAIPAPIGCAKGIGDALSDCGATQSSDRNSTDENYRRGARNTGLGSAYDKISENIDLVQAAYVARENWGKEYFGDLIYSDGWEDLSALLAPFVSRLDTIPAEEAIKIKNNLSGYEIQPAAIDTLISRWNISIKARKAGVMEPDTRNPGIINWNKVKGYSDYMIKVTEEAITKGYTSVYDMYEKEYKALNELIDQQKNAVCASVTMQLSQRLTMTREAFEGTLEIFNGHPSEKMDSLSVNIKITDENGVPRNDLFEIQTKSLSNLANITGTGAIASQQKGAVKFLFIPENAAAPTVGKIYNFSGSVTYWDPYAQGMVTMPLSSVPLTVNPSPNLMLHYFMERNILGDDALTSPDIEPSIPAELAVMIENQGYGAAVNMMISSAQPKITENEKGLAINFNLVGSNFQGQPKKLGVTDINFGTIPALQTRIGQWYFTSSLLGKFVSYDAKIVHANSFGNPDLSLVKGVKLHELTKSIKLYGSLEDGVNDFLVNDIFDINDVPDAIYYSQGSRTSKVYQAASGSFSTPVMAPTFKNQLTVAASEKGWNYIKLDDPGQKLYEIASVTRNDGQVIPLDNAWLTFVTLPLSQSPKYENKFHFIDSFPSIQPVTYTVAWKPRSTDIPEVDTIIGPPKDITSEQVKNVKVVFNKQIDGATFTYEDLNLTLQGGQNIINSSVVITQTDTSTFNVDLSKVSTGNGFYAFTVQASNVADVYGIKGNSGKRATWSQFGEIPFVQAFHGIPESRKATSYDKIEILFSVPIDVNSVTPPRFTIMKDSVVQEGMVTIDSVRTDHKLFYLSGLKNVLTQTGTYELIVDLPNIRSESQLKGAQKQSVLLTVDNTGPIVLRLEKSGTGGYDLQHIPYVNIRFNEDVPGFNTASVKLTRNGEVLPLTIDKLSNTDLKTWMAGNFGMLTYPDGNYTFTIDKSGLKDQVGNSGTGTQVVSWSVDRTSPIQITNLAITPDRGFSATDGVTIEEAHNVTFNLGKDAAEVLVYQKDIGGEKVIASRTNVVAGMVSIPFKLGSTGNTGIKVSVRGANGGTGTAEKVLVIDQVPLSGQWNFAQDQSITRQPDTLTVSLSSKLLSNEGFLSAIKVSKNGTPLSTAGLRFRLVNDTLYEVRGLRSAGVTPGNYQVSIDLQKLSKYSSGMTGSEPAILLWTVLSTNRAPVANAGNDTTIMALGTVTLKASGSSDPDGDKITYRWVAPEGIVLNDSTSATPSFTLTPSSQGKKYSFLLIVSDGTLFSTNMISVAVNISNLEHYRSLMTGNWNDPGIWQLSADSIVWKAANVSPIEKSKNIRIRSGHTVTVTEDVTIDKTFVEPGGTLAVAAGSTLTVLNNGLTMRSTEDGSGSIGESAGTIVGNVVVERFIPARRAWRLIAAPFRSSQTIREAWQEGGSIKPGFGTHITGKTSVNGFDPSPANNSSISYFSKPTNTFEPLSATNIPLTNQPAYFLFVRGDRTINLSIGSSAKATNTVLRAAGTLKTGTQAVQVPPSGFTLVGNPFASAIDFSRISKTNVPDRFFVWDPKRSTNGAYVLFEADNGYVPFNPGGSYTTANSLIQSGQAFFVEGSGTEGSLGIRESSKSGTQKSTFRIIDGDDEKLLINLKTIHTDNTTSVVDATVAKYSDRYTTAITAEDAGKPDNVDENLAIFRNERKFTIEKRPLIGDRDTLFLRVYNLGSKQYQFEIVPSHFDDLTMSAYLEDTYSHTVKRLSLQSTETVNFNITPDAASANPDRFRIIFKALKDRTGKLIKTKGYTKDAGIQIDWEVTMENNMRTYEVEKSTDGVHFEKTASVAAKGNSNTDQSYGWFDNHPIEGDNFYRIKSTDLSGNIQYGNLVNVKIGIERSSIVVYPNPVTNNIIFVQMTNKPQGNYLVQLYNVSGQQLLNTVIQHSGGSVTRTIRLQPVVSKGIYQLHISNGASTFTQKIIVE